MSKFKVGDRVRIVSKSIGDSYEWWLKKEPDIQRISEYRNYGGCFYVINGNYFKEHDLVKVEELQNITINKMSDIFNKIKLSRKSEPEKSFINAGIMTMDEKFTTEGKELWDNFLYTKFKGEFKTEIEPVLKELGEENKK